MSSAGEKDSKGSNSPGERDGGHVLGATRTYSRDNDSAEANKAALGPQSVDPLDAASKQWDFSDIDEKKLRRKIDFRLIPFLSLLYLLSFLDRSAIGNARLFHLEDELGMRGTQYNVAASIFYFSYAFFEVPSNVLLKRLTPSKWFGTITMLVGVCMLAQGVVTNYAGLLGARFALGVAEAGLFPGAQLLLSGWYPRKSFGLRSAIFFSAATVSGAFGGLLAVGLSKIRAGEYSEENDAWRWIFIVIGLATFVAGVSAFWLCADFPDTAKFLTPKERAWVVASLQADSQYSAAGESFTWRNFWKGWADIKTWVAALAYMGVDGPLYAFSVFTPTIIKSLGSYDSIESNLLSVPIYVFACIVTVAVGFLADRYGRRALINLILIVVGIIGYAILIGVDPRQTPGASYFGIYLAAAGIYPLIANTIALTGSHIEGTYKRGVVMGVVISWGNINGAATSQVYLPRQSPRYQMGHGIIILYLGIGWISSALYLYLIKRANAQRERGECSEIILDHMPESEAVPAAEEARAKAIADVKAQGGGLRNRWKAIKMQLHMESGMTYASVDEAKRLRGDDYSGHRYSY